MDDTEQLAKIHEILYKFEQNSHRHRIDALGEKQLTVKLATEKAQAAEAIADLLRTSVKSMGSGVSADWPTHPVDKQEKLAEFVADPGTISKAVEESMDKRVSVLYPEETTAKNVGDVVDGELRVQIDAINMKYMHNSGWNGHLEAEVYQLAMGEVMQLFDAHLQSAIQTERDRWIKASMQRLAKYDEIGVPPETQALIEAAVLEARIEENNPYTNLQDETEATHTEPCNFCGQLSHHHTCGEALVGVEQIAQRRLQQLKKGTSDEQL